MHVTIATAPCCWGGHCHHAGMDPVAALERNAGRTDYIHFKDIDRTAFECVMGRRVRFFDACAEGVMCPMGRGVIDHPSIREALEQQGHCGFITVEQERSDDAPPTSRRAATT